MMEKGKYIVELSALIPIRNINFYIDTCRAMSGVNLQKITGSDETESALRRLKIMISEELKLDPRTAIEIMINKVKDESIIEPRIGMKIIGKLIILYLRRGEFNEGTGHLSTIPFNFLSYSVVQDLRLHGEGPNLSFVEKCLDELAEHQIIDTGFHTLHVKSRSVKYTDQDMAAIFLGYSLASRAALLPIVPFPARPVSFVTVLIAELKKLLPRGEANRFIKSFRL